MTIEVAQKYIKDLLLNGEGYVEFIQSVEAVVKDDNEGEVTLDFDSCNIEDDQILFWSGAIDYKCEDFTELGLVRVMTEALHTFAHSKGGTIAVQYKNVKERHPDSLILFRIGDFYEAYFEDAEDASKILGITLTRRGTKPDDISLAGFPYQALDTYLPKLIRAGKRVAICDSLTEPITIKRRPVTPVHGFHR